MNVEKLLCNPTGVNRESTLQVDLLQEFLDAGVIAPTDLLKNVNNTPVWVLWLAENNDKPQATSVLIHTFSQIQGFSWTQDFENSEHDSQSPLDAVGQYLTSEQLVDILDGLPPEGLSHIKNKPLTTAHSFGLKKMVRAEREDLFEILLKYGWDINIKNDKKRSLLMDCANWKQAQMVLKHHPDLEVVDTSNNNILDCVRVWSRDENFNEILKQVNAHRTQPFNSSERVQQKLFEIIASQKVANLKKSLKDLKSLQSSTPLKDAQNRTPLLIVCENLRFQRNPSAQVAYGRFFVRFLNAFVPELEKYPNFGKDQPLSTVPGWSEYDHTMMTLVVSSNHVQGRFPTDLLSNDLKKAMNNWCVDRLPQLLPTLDAWTTLYLNDFMAHTYTTEDANVKAALNVCTFLGTHHLMPYQQMLFKEWSRLDQNSQVFHHLLGKWMEEGSLPHTHYSHQTVFRSYGVGSFACMWGLENSIEPKSDFEQSLVKFVLDQMHQLVTYIHNNKPLNAPVFAIMETKLVECAQNHPQLCTSWIEKIKNDLNEHTSSFDSPEHEEIVHRIQACVEKIVLLENLPSLGEKTCTRKM